MFKEQLEKDVSRIFDYVNYKDVYTYNLLQTDSWITTKKMVGVSYTSGIETQTMTYTLDELIRYGKSPGILLKQRL